MVNERWNIYRFTFALVVITGYYFCLVSLLTLSAISVDRLLALLLGLRYRQVVTLKRTYLAAISFWVFSFVGSIVYLWNDLISTWYSYTYCTTVSSYLALLLHKDFSEAASSSNSSARECSRTTKPNNSTKHYAIQRDCVHCTVVAVNISCLLFTSYFSGPVVNSGKISR